VYPVIGARPFTARCASAARAVPGSTTAGAGVRDDAGFDGRVRVGATGVGDRSAVELEEVAGEGSVPPGSLAPFVACPMVQSTTRTPKNTAALRCPDTPAGEHGARRSVRETAR
jgi:hypothetical protein